MKKLTAMISVMILVVCLCACGGPDAEELTLEDIIRANSLETLLDKHDNIYIREDTVNINGYVLDTSYRRFALEDGQLVGDVWHENAENKMVINARNGAIYGLMGQQKHVNIIPKDEYFDIVARLFPILPDTEMEVLHSVEEVDGELLVTTVRETFDDGSVSMGTEYRMDDRTLAIRSVHLIDYNERGQKTGIIGFTVEYDSKERPDDSAWDSITQMTDGSFCNVTAVLHPGTDAEETHTIQVVRDCDVEVMGKSSYDIYSDETCRINLPMVDTGSDSVTFYAKPIE